MISKAICLCIDKRRHFLPFLQKQFQELNIPLQLFIAGDGEILPKEQYDHIDTDNIDTRWSYGSGRTRRNNYNAYLCHQKMIQIAKDERLDNILLLEDDAIILKRFSLLIDSIMSLLEQTDWETCYFGYHKQNMTQEEQQYQIDKKLHILSGNNIGGFHGALINSKAYDKLLSIPPTMNMDVQCPRYTKLFYTIPRLIFYRNTYSNALCEHADARFKNYEQFLLEGLNIDEV